MLSSSLVLKPARKSTKRSRGSSNTHGLYITGVMTDQDKGEGPPFAYTIGNTEKDLPELLTIGISVRNSDVDHLNYLSKLMVERGKPFDDGEIVDLSKHYEGRYPTEVKIIVASGKARNIHNPRVAAPAE